jgi:hypothetical protein
MRAAHLRDPLPSDVWASVSDKSLARGKLGSRFRDPMLALAALDVDAPGGFSRSECPKLQKILLHRWGM